MARKTKEAIDRQRIYSREYQRRLCSTFSKSEIRERNLVQKYGITQLQYEDILEKQKGLCGICGVDRCPVRQVLSVDHDHKSGRVRGLLCSACNLALGGFGDNIEVLNKAIIWLQR